MKNMIFAMVTASVMLSSVFSACANNKADNDVTEVSAKTGSVQTETAAETMSSAAAVKKDAVYKYICDNYGKTMLLLRQLNFMVRTYLTADLPHNLTQIYLARIINI